MNLEQFPPGPWRAEGEDKIIVNDARGYTLVLCPGHTLALAQANSRLITASIPLLTALHNLTVWAGHTPAGRGSWQYVNATVLLCRVTGQTYQDTHYPPTDSTPKEESTP
jgi:hypothetical protein